MTLVSILVAALGWPAAVVFADDHAHVHGVVAGRSNEDGAVIVQTDDASTVFVLLADATKIRQVSGMRTMRMSSASLTPGLRVHITGRYWGEDRFIADRITFSPSSMKTARAIAGGIAPTDQRSVMNQERIEQQGRTIDEHGKTMDIQKRQIDANAERITATSGAVEATNARIASLDDFTAIASVTVHFENGKASISPKYRTRLEQLAEQARTTPGYVIQVQGFASAVGSEAQNQHLSKQRADAVTAVLQQRGVSPANVLVPAAMGTSEQVAPNTTAKGQAENRRAVVTLLRNKGIAGK